MDELLTNKQGICIVFLSTLGSSLVLGIANSAKENSWISVILGLIISLIVCYFYARLASNFPNKNFFQICEFCFGKIIGKIIVMLFIFYNLIVNALIIRDIGEFIYVVGIVNIREISQIFTMLITILLCIHMCKKGLSVLGRFCILFTPVVIFMLLIGYLLSINNMTPRNLLPILYDGIQPILSGTLTAITFPFTEAITFIMIADSLKDNASYFKILTKGVLFAGIVLLLMCTCDIMILGSDTFSSSYFPSYTSLRRIHIGDFLQRIEVTIILSFIFCVFVKSTCFLIATCKGIACLLNLKNYSFISTPVGFIVVCVSYLLYENLRESLDLAAFDTLNGTAFQLILFFIVFIVSKIKLKYMKEA